MIRTSLAILAAGLFASASVFAGDKGHCTQGVANEGKTECQNTFANLNLNQEQKSKMTALEQECSKAGCTKESQARFLKEAKGVLSADQYAQLKAQHDKPADGHKSRS